MSLNKFTLSFSNQEIEDRYIQENKTTRRNGLIIFFMLSSLAGLFSLVGYIITGSSQTLLIFWCDCLRTSLYITTYFLSPRIKCIQTILGTIANAIFALFLTEIYIYIGEPFFLVIR